MGGEMAQGDLFEGVVASPGTCAQRHSARRLRSAGVENGSSTP